MASGNSVFGIPNYVDIVTGQTQKVNSTNCVSGQPTQIIYDQNQMFSLQPSQVQQQIHVQPEMLSNMTNGQQAMMAQHAMMQQGMAVQQMMPGTQMIMAPGIGGYMQYPQAIHPAALGMAGQIGQLGQLSQMGMQPLIIQPMPIGHGRPSAKPVGHGRPGARPGIFGNTQSTGLLTDQSGAGKVKKKKPSPSARRRSRLR
jgi:hypothetical protein